MNEIIFEIQEASEGGYLAQALDYSIFTQAEDLETLRPQIKDAVNCHFDEAESRSRRVELMTGQLNTCPLYLVS